MKTLFLTGRLTVASFILAVLISQGALAQQIGSISGTVSESQSGTPMAGVQLIIESTNIGGVSGLDGSFELHGIPIGTRVIVARFIGYRTQSQTVELTQAGVSSINFSLQIQPILLGGVAVSATREQQAKTDIAASIGSINSEKIAEISPTHPSEIMSRIPGVWVNSTSGEGHMTAIRQPLSTSPLYLFLENGVPTRSTGFFNHNALYEINIPQASAIEVIKGPGTALYGSDAIGGVVNVSSGRIPYTPSYGATLEGGSYGYTRGLFTGGGTFGRNGLRLDVNISDSDGWRDQTAYKRQSATLRWERRVGYSSLLKTVAAWSNINQEPAGSSSVSEDDFNSDPTVNYTPVSFRDVRSFRVSSAYERYGTSTLLSVTPFFRFSSMDMLPNWALSFDPAIWESQNFSVGAQFKWRKDFDAYRSRLVLGADVDLSPGERTETGIVPTREGKIFTSYEMGDVQYNYDATYRQASPFVHAEMSPVPRVRLNAGLRLDVMGYDYSNNLTVEQTGSHRRPESTKQSYSHISPKLGVTFQAAEQINLFAAYRHAFRVPSERQLFRQGSSINSVELKPVKVDNFEAGLRGEFSSAFSYEMTAFSMTKRDDIVGFVFENGSRGSVNTGETSHRGLEAGVTLTSETGLFLSGAYTYVVHEYEKWETQLDEDLSGNEMEVAPRVIANAEAGFSFNFLEGAMIALEWNRLGSYWMDSANTSKYNGHDIVNLRASIGLTRSVSLVGAVRNLTDERYAEQATYNRFRGDEFSPGAPRQVNISLRANF